MIRLCLPNLALFHRATPPDPATEPVLFMISLGSPGGTLAELEAHARLEADERIGRSTPDRRVADTPFSPARIDCDARSCEKAVNVRANWHGMSALNGASIAVRNHLFVAHSGWMKGPRSAGR